MKIAQIAPLVESVPPQGYGGTERIVSYLTERLVQLGHDVTLFASADSRTSARLVPCAPRALRVDDRVRDHVPHTLIMLEHVRQLAAEFDLLHFHVDLLHFPLFRHISRRSLTTLHGRLDLPDLQPFFCEFFDLPLVSISMAQRAPMPPVAWAGNVPHGIPADLLAYEPNPAGDYLAFLGRISPEKRVDRAIRMARRVGMPLQIAAKIDRVDREYHDQLGDMLEDPLVTFLGEVGDDAKASFLGNARALLFPIDWPEPFGLVLIEAMACGTPVIAYPCGSVPEIVEHGVTGFIVREIGAGAQAIEAAEHLDRARIRQRFEERYTADRMTDDYLEIYRKLLEDAGGGPTNERPRRRRKRGSPAPSRTAAGAARS